jgi:beta-glucosidase
MYNDYFPPYKAAVDAGAGSVMASLMKLTEFQQLEQMVNDRGLKKPMGSGFVVTDYTGIPDDGAWNGRFTNGICFGIKCWN